MNARTKYDRLEFIDCARGIGILLVVIAHHLQNSESVLWWIYSFHMPLFFLISGYLYQHLDRKHTNLKETIVAGVKSFLWPYFTFNVIIVLWWLLLKIVVGAQPEESMWNIILRFLTTYGYHALWFLPTLFEVSTVSKTIKMQKRWILLGISVCIGFVLSCLIDSTSLIGRYWKYIAMYIGRFMLGLSFIEIGRYAYILDKKISENKEWLVLAGALCISFLFYDDNILVFMVFCRIGNVFLYYLNAVAGSIAILLIAKKVCTSWIGKKICFWGKNSLIVMSTHMDISIEIAWIVVGITKINKFLTLRDASVVAILIELIVLICIVKLINRYAKMIIYFPDQCENILNNKWRKS